MNVIFLKSGIAPIVWIKNRNTFRFQCLAIDTKSNKTMILYIEDPQKIRLIITDLVFDNKSYNISLKGKEITKIEL